METEFIKNAKRIMRERGLKQVQLAHKIGYDEQQMSALFCRMRIIRGTDIVKIADALDTTPNELLGWQEGQRPVNNTAGQNEI